MTSTVGLFPTGWNPAQDSPSAQIYCPSSTVPIPAHLERDLSGHLTLATSTAALTDGTTSFSTSDFASTNDIDGTNQNVDVIVFGDTNSFLTEVSGSNNTLDLTIDGSNSEVSIRMGSNNSTIDLRLEGDDASVAIISDDNFAR